MAQQRTLADVQNEANTIIDDDVAATRRMRHLVVEDQQMNEETLRNLDEQGEQLRRVERGLDGINANTRQAERELTKMEKCCGCCLCPCTPRHNFEKREGYNDVWKGHGDEHENAEAVIDEQPTAASARGGHAAARGGQKQMVKEITGDDREKEMNENLNVVSDVLGNLRAQAQAMGDELDEQNDTLARIDGKMTSDIARVQAASDRTAVLTKRA